MYRVIVISAEELLRLSLARNNANPGCKKIGITVQLGQFLEVSEYYFCIAKLFRDLEGMGKALLKKACRISENRS